MGQREIRDIAEGSYSPLMSQLDRIVRKYASSDELDREVLLAQLERVGSRKPQDIVERYDQIRDNFDRTSARKSRERLGLSRRRVAQESGTTFNIIKYYEEQGLPRKATQNVIAYISWLHQNELKLFGSEK